RPAEHRSFPRSITPANEQSAALRREAAESSTTNCCFLSPVPCLLLNPATTAVAVVPGPLNPVRQLPPAAHERRRWLPRGQAACHPFPAAGQTSARISSSGSPPPAALHRTWNNGPPFAALQS